MRSNLRSAITALILLLVCISVPVAEAQPGSVPGQIAQFAEGLANRGMRKVVVAAAFRCLNRGCEGLDRPVARQFAAVFSSANAAVKLVPDDEQKAILNRDGFLSIDLYLPSLPRYLAHRSGADAYVFGQMELRGADLKVRLLAKAPLDDKLIDQVEVVLPSSQIPAPENAPVQDATGVYLLGAGEVSHPKCKKCPPPEYTSEAYAQKERGIVMLVLTVEPNGQASNALPVVTMPAGLLERSIATVRKWTFTPAMLNGKPVPSRTTIEVTFDLR